MALISSTQSDFTLDDIDNEPKIATNIMQKFDITFMDFSNVIK